MYYSNTIVAAFEASINNLETLMQSRSTSVNPSPSSTFSLVPFNDPFPAQLNSTPFRTLLYSLFILKNTIFSERRLTKTLSAQTDLPTQVTYRFLKGVFIFLGNNHVVDEETPPPYPSGSDRNVDELNELSSRLSVFDTNFLNLPSDTGNKFETLARAEKSYINLLKEGVQTAETHIQLALYRTTLVYIVYWYQIL